MNNKITDTQIDKIKSIILRLQNSISEFQIINWLSQFDYTEWDTALEVLLKLEYFSAKRMMQEYNDGLIKIVERIDIFEKRETNNIINTLFLTSVEKSMNRHKSKLRANGKNKIFVHAIGDLGKSGSTMLYYVTHAPVFKSTNFKVLKNINELDVKNKNNTLHLVLIDDFSGTGDTIVDYIRKQISPKLIEKEINNIEIYVLCIAFMRKAKIKVIEEIKEYNISFIGNERIEAFSNIGSPFGYRPKMLKVREFCYEHGKGLYKKKEYKSDIETDYPLGYKNTQALIVFEHTTPNNTLPIIWSTTNNWMPLYSRNIKYKINEVKKFKNQTKIWLSLARDLGYNIILGQNKDIYTSENLKLLCYIRLIMKGSNRPTISQAMNLTTFELDEIINTGIKKGLLVDENTMTDFGRKLYNDIVKKLELSVEKNIETTKDIIYIPKIFRGKT